MPTSERRRAKRRTVRLFTRVIKNTLKKPEKLLVSEWAEKYRILDGSSNFEGHWTNGITPYLVGVMDAFNDPYIQEINFCKSTQVGGTEALLNMLGFIIMLAQAPTMIVYPNDKLAKKTSNRRLRPSLTKTPEIAERFYKNSSKELELNFKGMTLYLTGSGSPANLASTSIKYLFFDEIDKMEGASKKEASPYNLAKERTRTYTYSKKIYTCSTPTLKTNYVWDIHERADEQRNYFVPCPHCGEYIILYWKQIIYPKVNEKGKKLSNQERAQKAVYVCQKCGCEITDRNKIQMLKKGEWRDVKKTHIGRPSKVSFWINSLYSRFLTWKDIALEFLNSKDDPEKFQNFVNSWLAEPWEDTKLKTSVDLIKERETDLPEFVVPEWARLLTGGVDVQENCIYWTIRAWGEHITSQNIAHGQAVNLIELEDIMNLEYLTENGRRMIVNLVYIDSGYAADEVYDFCANNSEWAVPVKGSSKPLETYLKIGSVNRVSSKAHGMQLVHVDGDKYKDMIAGRMQRKNGKGSWMVYKDCDEEYAKQVTSEHKVRIKNGNREQLKWVTKKSHADNHYLDAEVYAMAAADRKEVRTMHLNNLNNLNKEPEVQEMETQEENWIQKNESWLGGGNGN